MGDVFDVGSGLAGGALGGLTGGLIGGGKDSIIPGLGGISSGLFGGSGKTGLFGTGGYEVAVDPYYNDKTKELADLLMGRATGATPSLAAETTRQALMDNLLQQQQGIRSIGGVSGALKQRMMANAGAQTGADIANKGGLLEMQERQGAQSLLSEVLLGKNKNDISEQGLKLNEQQERAKRRGNLIESGGQAIASMAGGGGGFGG